MNPQAQLDMDLLQRIPSFEEMKQQGGQAAADTIYNAFGDTSGAISQAAVGQEKIFGVSVPAGGMVNMGHKSLAAGSGEAVLGAEAVLNQRCHFIRVMEGTACQKAVDLVGKLIDSIADSIGGSYGAMANIAWQQGHSGFADVKTAAQNLSAENMVQTGENLIDNATRMSNGFEFPSWGAAIRGAVAVIIKQVIGPLIKELVRSLCQMFFSAIASLLGCDQPNSSNPAQAPGAGAAGSGGSSPIPTQPLPGSPANVPVPNAPVVRISNAGAAAINNAYSNALVARISANQIANSVAENIKIPPKIGYIPPKRETPWTTYAVWAGVILAAVAGVSKVRTGRYVPPVVARRF